MRFRNILLVFCLIVSILCLTAGYGFAGKWNGALIAIILGLAWLPARKYAGTWLTHGFLFASVSISVTGLLEGLPSVLMICGSGFALAVWDLALLNVALGTNSSGEQNRRYENKHVQSLALALGAGLLIALFGRLLNFQVPFMLMLLLVGLVIFGLDRVWGAIKRRNIQ